MKKLFMLIIAVFLLSACGNSNTISKQDILEVCVDSVGYLVEEVNQAKVIEKNGYQVQFNYGSNGYSFLVGNDGIILNRIVKSLEETKYEENIEEKIKEKIKEKRLKISAEKEIIQENAKANENQDYFRGMAYWNSLMYFGINEDTIIDSRIDYSEDGSMIVVIGLDDGNRLVSITDSSGELINAYID